MLEHRIQQMLERRMQQMLERRMQQMLERKMQKAVGKACGIAGIRKAFMMVLVQSVQL